jgi:uncharacterized membrane protein
MLEFITVLASTLFAGAAIYINVAEHPARMECGTELAATVFGPSYRRAAVMQVSLALIAAIAGLLCWWMNGRILWLVGALMILSVIPFTFFAIMPTNRQLLDPGLDRTSEATRRLLERWGTLHAVRSIISLLASSIFLLLVVRP